MVRLQDSIRVSAFLALIFTLPLTTSADYQVDWWSIDGGGQMWASGGGYSLGGTAGQPDAGRLSGGSYSIVGGYWAALAPAGPALCQGDLNCDGVVDFFDIDLFVEALGYPGGVGWPYPGCPWANADCDVDGDVDFFDIDPFVENLGTVCP